MADLWFYHLERRRPEDVLPTLLKMTLGRGWRAVVQAGSPERVTHLDGHLWTYDPASFLPHGRADRPQAQNQPVLLTDGEENGNGAQVRFLVDGAWSDQLDGYERVILIFDGQDSAQVSAARGYWKAGKAAGHAVTYWQEGPCGKWEKKA